MVLGLIDFLLGGKKKTKVPKSGQVTTPLNGVGGNVAQQNTSQGVTVPDGAANPTENTNPSGSADEVKFEDSSNDDADNSQQQQPAAVQNTNSSMGRSSASEVLRKISEELKSTNERVTELVTSVKNVENTVNALGHRIDELEESKKVTDEKLGDIDGNMSKFLSLYELVNNQYNPFVEQINAEKAQPKEIVIGADGNSSEGNNSEPKSFEDLDLKAVKPIDLGNDLDSSLLELDTLNIEEAAGDAVPLTNLKNNTNSLVIILSWLEYLIKKVGIEETRNSLRYYTEVLRWITPEVYFDLDKYLRGMKDKKDLNEDDKLNVKDHIVSLYFISKLNEKALDERLTKAVLQIIKA